METHQIGLRDVKATRAPQRSRILAPLRYLSIEAPGKPFYDYWLPAVVAVVTGAGYFVLTSRPPLFGATGLLQLIHGFFVMAVPFLFGALAAVAMGSPGAYLDRRAPGVEILLDGEVLSLRQFVCYLLGYLCFLGLITFIAITASIIAEPYVDFGGVMPAVLSDGLFGLYVMGMFALIATFTITIFWALYFLTDVVNRRD